jgi:uncharacterized membrane protein (UPF0136 family)
MAHAAAAVTLVYGILVLLGGLFGYLKARSKPSLVMGGALGAALIAVGIAGLNQWTSAAVWAACLSAFLLAFFGMRYMRKKRFMPAGMLCALSLIALAVNLAAVLAART